MKITTYNKLVRDRIPEIIEKSGKKALVETLDPASYKAMLDQKLGEELREYLDSDTAEELADLVEIVYAILDYKNVSLEEFESIRLKKAEDRGAFAKRILLNEVIDDQG